jgi:hypothetical protein
MKYMRSTSFTRMPSGASSSGGWPELGTQPKERTECD